MIDEEMRERVRKHQEAREKSQWTVVEETADLSGALQAAGKNQVLLVDCLTLWINNLLYMAKEKGEDLTEEFIAGKCREILRVCAGLSGTIIFVTNEVGMGIVPENPLSRCYRDLVGRCNQIMAEGADTVIFVVSGLPLHLKGDKAL